MLPAGGSGVPDHVAARNGPLGQAREGLLQRAFLTICRLDLLSAVLGGEVGSGKSRALEIKLVPPDTLPLTCPSFRVKLSQKPQPTKPNPNGPGV